MLIKILKAGTYNDIHHRALVLEAGNEIETSEWYGLSLIASAYAEAVQKKACIPEPIKPQITKPEKVAAQITEPEAAGEMPDPTDPPKTEGSELRKRRVKEIAE